MSIYQPAIHGTGHDEYKQLTDIFTTKKINNVGKKKITTTYDDAQTKETGTSEAEYDNDIYLTPIMQTFDYEEPIKH